MLAQTQAVGCGSFKTARFDVRLRPNVDGISSLPAPLFEKVRLRKRGIGVKEKKKAKRLVPYVVYVIFDGTIKYFD